VGGSFQWIYQLVLTATLGVIAYFLRDMKKSFEDKHLQNKCEISKVQEDLEDFKEKVADKYVMKEDFVRSITSVDKRFDVLDEKLDKIYYTMCKKGSEG
jgi:hypothetical protein